MGDNLWSQLAKSGTVRNKSSIEESGLRKVQNFIDKGIQNAESKRVSYKDADNKVLGFLGNVGADVTTNILGGAKMLITHPMETAESLKNAPQAFINGVKNLPETMYQYPVTTAATVAPVVGGAKGVTNVMNKGSIVKGGVKAPTTQVQNASGLNIKTNPNAVKVYDYEPKKLPTAGEYDLTSIEGMKNIQDKGLRDLLSQGDTEVQTYYHGSPNPNIDVLDPSFNERGLYGKGTYLANRSSEAVDQGMGNTLYTVETPHNQYLMDYYTSVGKQGGIPKYLADKLGLPENTVGGELYDALVERLGSKEAASKLLDDMGVKGHVVRFSDGNKYKVLYDKDSARIVDKYTRGQ